MSDYLPVPRKPKPPARTVDAASAPPVAPAIGGHMRGILISRGGNIVFPPRSRTVIELTEQLGQFGPELDLGHGEIALVSVRINRTVVGSTGQS